MLKLGARGVFGDERGANEAALALAEHCQFADAPHVTAQLATQLINDFVLNAPKDAAMLLLLPRLLALSGHDAAQLGAIVGAKWPPKCVIPLLDACRELAGVAGEQADGIVLRVVAQLRALEFDVASMPPVLAHLLQFATAKQRVDTFLPALCGLFEHLSARNAGERRSDEQRTLYHVEGTVLLQCEFAMRHQQALASKLIALVKADRVALRSPFAFALLLTAGAVPRFERDAFQLARAVVLRSCETAVDLEELPLHSVRSAFEQLGAQPVSSATRGAMAVALPAVVPRALLACVEHSENGWDHVIEALVRLGQLLVAPRRQVRAPVAALQAAIGRSLLAALFAQRPAARGAIVQYVVAQLMLSSDAAPHCVRLLETIVRHAGHHLAPHTRALRDALECMPTLQPAHLAPHLISALSPLLADGVSESGAQLRDTAMLVLRKSLFARAEDARRAACDGFLSLMQHVALVECRCGQGGVSGLCRCRPEMCDAALVTCHEIVAALQRCCSQQASVRSRLYAGLTAFVRQLARHATNEHIRARDQSQLALRQCAELLDAALSLLLTQLARFCAGNLDELASAADPAARNAVAVPLNLDRAFDVDGAPRGSVPVLLEPLHELLACLVSCVYGARALAAAAGLHRAASSAYARACRALAYLAAQVARAELEDFALDVSTPFAASSTAGLFNQARGQLLLGVYEALAGYAVLSRALPHAAGDRAPPLINAVADASAFIALYGVLFAVMREGEKGPGVAMSVAKKARGAAAAADDDDDGDDGGADDDEPLAARSSKGKGKAKAAPPPADRRAKIGAALAGATLRFDTHAALQLLTIGLGGDACAAQWPDATPQQREHATARVRGDVDLRHHVLRAVTQYLDAVGGDLRVADPISRDVRQHFRGVGVFDVHALVASQSSATTAAMAPNAPGTAPSGDGQVELASLARQRQVETHQHCVALARVLLLEYERTASGERELKRNNKPLPTLALECFVKAWLLLTGGGEIALSDIVTTAKTVFERDYETARQQLELRAVGKSSRSTSDNSARPSMHSMSRDVRDEPEEVEPDVVEHPSNSSDRRRDKAFHRRPLLFQAIGCALVERASRLVGAAQLREAELMLQCLAPIVARSPGPCADKLSAALEALMSQQDGEPLKSAALCRVLVSLFSTAETRSADVEHHKETIKIVQAVEMVLGSTNRERLPGTPSVHACIAHNQSIVHITTALHAVIEARLDAAETVVDFVRRVLAACPQAMQLVRFNAPAGTVLDLATLTIKAEARSDAASPQLLPPPLAPVSNRNAAAPPPRGKSAGAAVAFPQLDPIQYRSVAALANSVLSALDQVYIMLRIIVAIETRITAAALPPACAERHTRLLTKTMRLLAAIVREPSAAATRRQPTNRALRLVNAASQHLVRPCSNWITYLSTLPTGSLKSIVAAKKRARAGGDADDDDADDGDASGDDGNDVASALGRLNQQAQNEKSVERDSRLVPSLVEAVEKYSTSLIKYSKLSKVEALLDGEGDDAGVVREFSLDIEAIKAALRARGADMDGDNDNNEDDDDDDDDDDAKKKATKKRKNKARFDYDDDDDNDNGDGDDGDETEVGSETRLPEDF